MKKVQIVLVLGIMLAVLSACETMKGFGKDMEAAGDWVQEKAE